MLEVNYKQVPQKKNLLWINDINQLLRNKKNNRNVNTMTKMTDQYNVNVPNDKKSPT